MSEFILTVQAEDGSEREHLFAISHDEQSPLHWRFPQVISAELCRCHAMISDFDTATLKSLIKQLLVKVKIAAKRHLQLTTKQELALKYLQMRVGTSGHWNLTASDPATAWTHKHGDICLAKLPTWVGLRPTAYLKISKGIRPGLRMIDAAVLRLEGRSGDVVLELRTLAELGKSGVTREEVDDLIEYGDQLAKRYA